MNAKTQIKDVVLANRAAEDSRAVVEAVEWAAVEDTLLAIENRYPLPDFETYLDAGRAL